MQLGVSVQKTTFLLLACVGLLATAGAQVPEPILGPKPGRCAVVRWWPSVMYRVNPINV